MQTIVHVNTPSLKVVAILMGREALEVFHEEITFFNIIETKTKGPFFQDSVDLLVHTEEEIRTFCILLSVFCTSSLYSLVVVFGELVQAEARAWS